MSALALLQASCTSQPPNKSAASGPDVVGDTSEGEKDSDAAHWRQPGSAQNDSPPEEKKVAEEAPRPLPEISKNLPDSFECSGHTCYEFADSRQALVPVILAHRAQLIAFGEAHARATFKGTTTVNRFANELLPTISDGASHLLLELLNPPKEGCQEEKKVAEKESKEVTKGQSQNNQAEYFALGKKARDLKVLPDILQTTCKDLEFIAKEGVIGYMETIAQLGEKGLKERLQDTRKGRPLVLWYGGAHHNDLSPKAGLETWAFGSAMSEFAKGSYLEIDLFVPEGIGDSDTWKSFAWYDAYQALDHKKGAILMKWGERSYSLFLEPGR